MGHIMKLIRQSAAFKIAGSMAFQEAVKNAEPSLLEPIMKVGGCLALKIFRRGCW